LQNKTVFGKFMGLFNQRNNKKHLVSILGTLVLTMLAFPAIALDLGRLQILSRIGEPLRAEVEIAQASSNELSSLRAKLAAPEQFGEAGMEFNPALDGVTASVQTRSNGTSFIALTGVRPLRENFVDLILETQWATGRLVKNYALLLNSISERAPTPAATVTPLSNSASINTLTANPSTFEQPLRVHSAQTAPIPQPRQINQNNVQPDGLETASVTLNDQNVPVYRFEPIENAPTTSASASTVLPTPALAARPLPRPRPTFEPATSSLSPTSFKVSPGDTASQLALRHLAPNVSMDQMLLAMLKLNPNAFIQGNVNLVKAGAVLRIPSPDQALLVPRAQARRIVLAQNRDFAEYAQRLAQSALLVDAPNNREMSGKVGVQAPNQPTPSTQPDRLTLSKSSLQNNDAEAALALQLEAKDSSNKLALLNQNLRDLEALVNSPPSTLFNASEERRPALDAPTETPGPSLGSQPPIDAQANEPTSDQPKSTMAVWLQNFQDDKQLWAWVGGLLALILFFIFWARRKSSDPETVYSPSYDDIPPQGTDPVMGQSVSNSGIPPQMSAIDLNLQSPPSAAPFASGSSVETELNKLNLATQLLSAGDKELARTLITSVIASSSGDLKAKATQLLGQIR
jgi:pilus assembly protein FimV